MGQDGWRGWASREAMEDGVLLSFGRPEQATGLRG